MSGRPSDGPTSIGRVRGGGITDPRWGRVGGHDRGAAPPDDAAQPLGAEALQHNGSQASAGGPDWTPQVLQLRWPTG